MSDFFKNVPEGLSYDDVYLVPDYSNIVSLSDVDVSTSLLGLNSKFPFIPANRRAITEARMVSAICEQGGIAAFHRYISPDQLLEQIKTLPLHCQGRWGLSVRRNWNWTKDVFDLIEQNLPEDYWPAFVIIDVAHGDHISVVEAIKKISDYDPINQKIKIIAGNVCTAHGAIRLVDAGADIIKVGFGLGSVRIARITRIVTGCGYPQLSAIMNVTSGLREHFDHHIPVIDDSGIKHMGDAVKAIAAGADMVMVGDLFSGCDEAPGEIYADGTDPNPNQIAEEGTTVRTPAKMLVKDVVSRLKLGVTNGFSYCGCKNIHELQKYGSEPYAWVRTTHSSKEEGCLHGVLRNEV